jgi:cellulose biosynthesis protein BcsQ
MQNILQHFLIERVNKMQVVTVNSEKGGTGKTTISTHVAALLAARGRRVLLVDFDPQGNGGLSFGLQPEPGLYNMLVRGVDIADVIRQPKTESYCPPGVEPKGKLYVLPGNPETHAITTVVEDRDAFADALDDIAHLLDVVVIDTAPSPGMLLTLAYRATQWLLIPAQMEFLSMVGLTNTISRAMKAGIKLMGIQPNQFRANTDLHKWHYTQLCEAAGANNWPVWEPIPLSISWAEASTMRTMVYSLEGNVGKARAEALALASRVEAVLNG